MGRKRGGWEHRKAFSVIPSVLGGLEGILGPGATWSEGDGAWTRAVAVGKKGIELGHVLN